MWNYCGNSIVGSGALHPALKPLEWMLGSWKTMDGFGHYPTIKDFRYVEQIDFFHVGQPNLQFMQVNLYITLLYKSSVVKSRGQEQFVGHQCL